MGKRKVPSAVLFASATYGKINDEILEGTWKDDTLRLQQKPAAPRQALQSLLDNKFPKKPSPVQTVAVCRLITRRSVGDQSERNGFIDSVNKLAAGYPKKSPNTENPHLSNGNFAPDLGKRRSIQFL